MQNKERFDKRLMSLAQNGLRLLIAQEIHDPSVGARQTTLTKFFPLDGSQIVSVDNGFSDNMPSITDQERYNLLNLCYEIYRALKQNVVPHLNDLKSSMAEAKKREQDWDDRVLEHLGKACLNPEELDDFEKSVVQPFFDTCRRTEDLHSSTLTITQDLLEGCECILQELRELAQSLGIVIESEQRGLETMERFLGESFDANGTKA